MKRTMITVALVIWVFAGKAQITVRENLEKLAEGLHNALVVDIPEADRDDVGRAWRKLMKGGNAKVSGRSEIVAANVRIPLITTDTLFIFTTFEKKDGYVHMASGFRIMDDFLSSTSNPAAYREAERVILNFAIDQARNAVQKRVDSEKKILSRLERNFKSLNEENKDLGENIQSWEKKIKDAKSTIQDNEKKIETTGKEIEVQRKALETVQQKLKEIK